MSEPIKLPDVELFDNFKSQWPTLGVELEFWLVDAETGDPVSKVIDPQTGAEVGLATHLLRQWEGHPELGDGHVVGELFECMLEVTTNPSRTVSDAVGGLERKLVVIRRELATLARNDPNFPELKLLTSGTHPFADPHDHPNRPNERYERIRRAIGLPVREMMTAGLHVHVGMPSANQSVRAMNILRTYSPILQALTGSSPFWEGRDTGRESMRKAIYEVLPNTGLPPEKIYNWGDYKKKLAERVLHGVGEPAELAAAAQELKGLAGEAREKAVEKIRKLWHISAKELWWSARPNSQLGTTEARAPEAPVTLREAGAVAALIQCLVAPVVRQDLGGELDTLAVTGWLGLDADTLDINMERAAVSGLDAELFTRHNGATRSAREWVNDIVDKLAPDDRTKSLAAKLGCYDELRYLKEMAEMGTSAAYQRQIVKMGGGLRDVVDLVSESLENGERVPLPHISDRSRASVSTDRDLDAPIPPVIPGRPRMIDLVRHAQMSLV